MNESVPRRWLVFAEEAPKFPIVETCIAGVLCGVMGDKIVVAVVLLVDPSNLYFPRPVLEVVFWVCKGAVLLACG